MAICARLLFLGFIFGVAADICGARCAQILQPVQEARMVVDAHPYVVNAFALCTAAADAAGHDAALAEPLASLLAEEQAPSWSPLPPDSPFRALYHGELRLHQGE